MANYSFDLSDHNDYLKKLRAEFADLRADPMSSRHAMNFAMNAYHMLEWVWEHEPGMAQKFSDNSAFRSTVYRKCPPIKVMRDLSNGSKHTNIKRTQNPAVSSTAVHKGAFQTNAFQSDAFDVGALKVNMADGTSHNFIDDAAAVMAFWDGAFRDGFQI
jgi:hypothetical protein